MVLSMSAYKTHRRGMLAAGNGSVCSITTRSPRSAIQISKVCTCSRRFTRATPGLTSNRIAFEMVSQGLLHLAVLALKHLVVLLAESRRATALVVVNTRFESMYCR